MARLAFIVCHLSGTGHLVRTLRLGAAAMARGHEVLVISGGRALAHVDDLGVRVLDLPPLTVTGLDFSTLVTPDGLPADEAYRQERVAQIQNHIAAFTPDVLITELFPLGRRMLAGEFLAAIEAADNALILSSVRDIPEPKLKRLNEAADHLRRHFDGVLVHGDDRLVPLAATWPLPEDLMRVIYHTGYVAPPPSVAGPRGKEILVATGGGNLGRFLVQVAIKAAALSPHPWRILVGGPDAAEISASAMVDHGSANLTVEPARQDYPDLLANAACSVSLCGYNTAVELAGLSTPAILVPSEEGGEQEQLLRASALAGHEGIDVIRERDLTPEVLTPAADALTAGPRRPAIPLRTDQGEAAIACIEALLKDRIP
ncbi:MAG: glycosyltransferase [Pseudomonadota bacterium]